MVSGDQAGSTWEVEQKYRLSDKDSLEEFLVHLGATEPQIENQVDTYLRHPCRDFRATDEALRIRSIDGEAMVTYKGPRLAGPVKIRPETELPLARDTAGGWLQIWQSLGFVIAAQVSKQRRVRQVTHRETTFTIAIDLVEKLGSFVEIELIIHHLDDREHAQNQIQMLAKELGLEQVEKRSYLGMLLEARERSSK